MFLSLLDWQNTQNPTKLHGIYIPCAAACPANKGCNSKYITYVCTYFSHLARALTHTRALGWRCRIYTQTRDASGAASSLNGLVSHGLWSARETERGRERGERERAAGGEISMGRLPPVCLPPFLTCLTASLRLTTPNYFSLAPSRSFSLRVSLTSSLSLSLSLSLSFARAPYRYMCEYVYVSLGEERFLLSALGRAAAHVCVFSASPSLRDRDSLRKRIFDLRSSACGASGRTDDRFYFQLFRRPSTPSKLAPVCARALCSLTLGTRSPFRLRPTTISCPQRYIRALIIIPFTAFRGLYFFFFFIALVFMRSLFATNWIK